jgi:hypothetical protein
MLDKYHMLSYRQQISDCVMFFAKKHSAPRLCVKGKNGKKSVLNWCVRLGKKKRTALQPSAFVSWPRGP